MTQSHHTQAIDDLREAPQDGIKIIPSTPMRAPDYRDAWGGGTEAEMQAWRARGQELHRAVTTMASMLRQREWAEHVSGDPDISALESQISELVGRVNAAVYAAAELASSQGARMEGQLKVAVDLLREVVGPLEVSAAVIEDEDGGAAMEELLSNVKRCVEQFDKSGIRLAEGVKL